MRAPFRFGSGWLVSIWLASAASSAQGVPSPYLPPGAPYPQPGSPGPYPSYPTAPYPPPPAPYGPPAAYGQPSFAPRIKYKEGMAPPAGYHFEESPRKGLVIAGSITLGSTYFISALIGGSSTNRDDRWLLVPVFGPFVDFGERSSRGCLTANSPNVDCELFEPVIQTYLILDGIAQTAGGVLLVLGFLLPKKEFVSDAYYGLSSGGPHVASWTVVPQVAPGMRYGVSLVGELF